MKSHTPAQVAPPARSVVVEGAATYAGVRVDHPSIVSVIKNMVKQNKRIEEIMRVTGMPGEVIRRYMK